MSGLEVWCGPKRANRFAEILWLKAEGILTIVSGGDEAVESIAARWANWIRLNATKDADVRARERREICQRVIRQCGGTHFVYDLLQRIKHRA